MTSSRRAAIVVALVTALGVARSPALAQSREPTPQELETARTLYKEGKELRSAGRLPEALEKLQAAHALGHTPVTGIELARTYVQVGKLVEAREVALGIARLPVERDETEKSADARTDAARLADELRPRIPSLSIQIRGLGAGDTPHLAIDGEDVPDAALSEPLKVNPGPHEVVVRVGEGAAAREARSSAPAGEGQTVAVTLEVPPAPPSPPPPPPPAKPLLAPEHHGFSVPERIAFGVGLAGVGVGLLAGAAALSLKDQLPGECPDSKCGNNNSGAGDLHGAYTWATVSTASFVIGGLGAAAGLVLMLIDRPAPAAAPAQSGTRSAPVPPAPASDLSIRPWLGLGAAGVDGRF